MKPGSSANMQELNWLQRICFKIQYQPIFSIKMIKIFITGLIGPLTWTGSVVIRPVSVDFNRLNSCMNPTIWTCQVLIYYVLILTCLHLYKCTEIEILWSYHRYKKCTRVGSTSNRMPCRSSCFDFQTFWTSY